jgi:hypothetical protein
MVRDLCRLRTEVGFRRGTIKILQPIQRLNFTFGMLDDDNGSGRP